MIIYPDQISADLESFFCIFVTSPEKEDGTPTFPSLGNSVGQILEFNINRRPPG